MNKFPWWASLLMWPPINTVVEGAAMLVGRRLCLSATGDKFRVCFMPEAEYKLVYPPEYW